MNLLVFKPEQYLACRTKIRVTGTQHIHLKNILKVSIDRHINVGELNGQVGVAKVVHIETDHTVLSVDLFKQAIPPLPLTMILALPRPQMIKRILQTVATMGVKNLHLIQTHKVEKNYWQSPSVTPNSIFEHLHLGLQQGGTTFLPHVYKHTKFDDFLKNYACDIVSQHDSSLIAHLCETQNCPSFNNSPTTKAALAIGPEGGFTDKEVMAFEKIGFNKVQLGKRILKVETAVSALISKLYY